MGGVSVRVGVHRGLVYLDSVQDDVYGLGANVSARVSSLAPPGSVVVSDAVAPLVRASFELQARPAAAAKGVDGLVVHHQVLGERVEPVRVGRGPLVGRDREVAYLQECWARARTGTLSTPGDRRGVSFGEPCDGLVAEARRADAGALSPTMSSSVANPRAPVSLTPLAAFPPPAGSRTGASRRVTPVNRPKRCW